MEREEGPCAASHAPHCRSGPLCCRLPLAAAHLQALDKDSNGSIELVDLRKFIQTVCAEAQMEVGSWGALGDGRRGKGPGAGAGRA